MTQYIPEHFDIREFVPPQTWGQFGKSSLWFMDDRVLITADQLRDRYGPVVINNWHFWKPGQWYSDKRKWSGLRIKGCPYGSAYSQHRFGRAADCLFRDTTAEAVRQDIMNNIDLFPLIHSIELDTGWLHFDVRNCDRIMTYKP